MKDSTVVIYVHHESALGGAPLSLLYLLRKLDRSRYSPHVICLKEGAAADLYRKEGLPVRVISGPDLSHTNLVWFPIHKLPKLLWRMFFSIPLFFRLRCAFSKIAKESRRTLIHLNSSTLLTAALAARCAGLPVVWHIREPLAQGHFGIRKKLLGFAIRHLSTQIIAISQHDAAQVGVSDKISVIHNFVDFAQFDRNLPRGAIRKELQIGANDPCLLFLGGSTHVKGIETLLSAFPIVLKSFPSTRLILAGGSEVDLWKQIENLPERKSIHVLGPRSDVPALIADCTLLLFPAIVPHFARPVIEAAAMAKPAIASDLGGVKELVKKNETAVLVTPNDPRALADAIVDLLQDPARLHRLGEEAYHWAREKFDARQNAVATFAVYEKIFPNT